MNVADKAWSVIREKFGLKDGERPALEREAAVLQKKFLDESKGDSMLALGLMALYVIDVVHAASGTPKSTLLAEFVAAAPHPQVMAQAIARAEEQQLKGGTCKP